MKMDGKCMNIYETEKCRLTISKDYVNDKNEIWL